jgi:hypothetical protein
MFDPVIAPSGTLLGLLQRGRGDGTLHALTAPRAEALAALNHCVLRDPRHDWQVENRSLYYARLFLDLSGELDEIEAHLFDATTSSTRTSHARASRSPSSAISPRTAGVTRSNCSGGTPPAAPTGPGPSTNWRCATTTQDCAPSPLPSSPGSPPTRGRGRTGAVVRDAFEPRPWRLWAEDPRESIGTRVRAAQESGSFDRWQRQMRPSGPRPEWSVRAVFEWAQQGVERGAALHVPAARCLTAVAGPEDRPEIVEAARTAPTARAARPCAISPTARIPTPST